MSSYPMEQKSPTYSIVSEISCSIKYENIGLFWAKAVWCTSLLHKEPYFAASCAPQLYDVRQLTYSMVSDHMTVAHGLSCVVAHRHSTSYHWPHTATHCNTLQHTGHRLSMCDSRCATHILSLTTHCNTLQHTATHCNTLQHTATHWNMSHIDCQS